MGGASCARAIEAGQGRAEEGAIYVLDMGAPVRIIDLARNMIELSGLTVRDEANPDGDIEIKDVGLRPGEKLYEELLIGNNPTIRMSTSSKLDGRFWLFRLLARRN